VAGGREDQAEADEGDEAEAEADPGSPVREVGSRWRELEAAFARREWRRSISALLHARWY
jgi:hypothetical protein